MSDHAETDQLQTILGEILAHAPRYGPVLLERAPLLEREGKTQEAIEAANRALGGDGNDAGSIREAHVILAKSYFMLGQREKAEDENRL